MKQMCCFAYNCFFQSHVNLLSFTILFSQICENDQRIVKWLDTSALSLEITTSEAISMYYFSSVLHKLLTDFLEKHIPLRFMQQFIQLHKHVNL